MKGLIFLILFLSSLAASQMHAKCHMTSAYPPPSNRTIVWHTINLDTPAYNRWQEIATIYKEGIQTVIDQVYNHLDSRIVNDILSYITDNEDEILARFPNDYGEEIRGIADTADVDLNMAILCNIMYEIMGLCTSIVAQNSTGHIFHGRNLDFGLFLGWNWTDDQWIVTNELRPILFNANMIKNNVTLYNGVFYAGYVGLLTGTRKNAFSTTVDTRYDNNYDKYLIEWFRNTNDTSQFLAFTTRSVMESIDNYEDAVTTITNTPLIGPAYVIIGGINENEGAVLTMGPNKTLEDIWSIPEALPANSTSKWYVLETNYDHWNQPPWFDDRRYPAEDCMNEIGTENIALPTLYNVLNGKPNRNRLTTYTALIDTARGHLESYLQYCDDPDCVPWEKKKKKL